MIYFQMHDFFQPHYPKQCNPQITRCLFFNSFLVFYIQIYIQVIQNHDAKYFTSYAANPLDWQDKQEIKVITSHKSIHIFLTHGYF